MGIKVSKSTPIFVDNMDVILKKTNTGITPNKKTVAPIYHFVREHVSRNVLEMRKINTSNNFSDPFTEPLVSNYFHGFYHDCMVNE